MEPRGIREVKTIADLSRAYRLHVHDELAVAHVWSGSTLAWIDGKTIPVAGECLVVIPPGVAHACNPVVDSGWNYTQALLDSRACPEALLEAPNRVLPSTRRLREVFTALRDGRDEPVSGILEVLREAVEGGGGAPAGTEAPMRSAALRRVMGHLRTHLAGPLSLDELCAIALLSKYHLVRSFKRAYGLTPHAYHLNLRVNEAKARLRQGLDVATVALDAGFCDQSHFHRVFTRCVGMTPAAYQKATAIPSKNPPRPPP